MHFYTEKHNQIPLADQLALICYSTENVNKLKRVKAATKLNFERLLNDPNVEMKCIGSFGSRYNDENQNGNFKQNTLKEYFINGQLTSPQRKIDKYSKRMNEELKS